MGKGKYASEGEKEGAIKEDGEELGERMPGKGPESTSRWLCSTARSENGTRAAGTKTPVGMLTSML